MKSLILMSIFFSYSAIANDCESCRLNERQQDSLEKINQKVACKEIYENIEEVRDRLAYITFDNFERISDYSTVEKHISNSKKLILEINERKNYPADLKSEFNYINNRMNASKTRTEAYVEGSKGSQPEDEIYGTLIYSMNQVCWKEIRTTFETVMDKNIAFIYSRKLFEPQIKFKARITKTVLENLKD